MKAKRILSIVMCLVVLVCCMSGCAGSDSSKESSSSDTITITDHAGETVEVPKNIDRIVVANIYPLPSVLSIFFDSADKLVGIAPQSMTAAQNSLLGEVYPELLKAKTEFFDGTNINVEELIALDPDVVFYSTDMPALRETIEGAGIPAVAVSASKWEYDAVETLNQWIDLLSQMFPENDKAKLCREKSEEIEKLVADRLSSLAEEDKPKVFTLFQYNDTTIATPGNASFGNWWAQTLGAKNVGSELQGSNGVPVNMEQVYEWNPDIILITNFNSAQPDTIYTNAFGAFDWSGITAVQNKRVYKMPLGMYRSYTAGIDTPITLLWLAKTIHPDLFSDINVTEQAISYYKDIFGLELTKEQVEKIFAPVSDAAAWN